MAKGVLGGAVLAERDACVFSGELDATQLSPSKRTNNDSPREGNPRITAMVQVMASETQLQHGITRSRALLRHAKSKIASLFGKVFASNRSSCAVSAFRF
jgi:hypothetical protein